MKRTMLGWSYCFRMRPSCKNFFFCSSESVSLHVFTATSSPRYFPLNTSPKFPYNKLQPSRHALKIATCESEKGITDASTWKFSVSSSTYGFRSEAVCLDRHARSRSCMQCRTSVWYCMFLPHRECSGLLSVWHTDRYAHTLTKYFKFSTADLRADRDQIFSLKY